MSGSNNMMPYSSLLFFFSQTYHQEQRTPDPNILIWSRISDQLYPDVDRHDLQRLDSSRHHPGYRLWLLPVWLA